MILSVSLSGRSKRVDQIPNGSVFSCRSCHNGNGGSRNSFGSQIGNGYLDGNGDVVWGSDLASLDADNDNASNGFELQDENGTWTQGSSDPGDQSLVTNPGDASSVGVDIGLTEFAETFELYHNYPNPFNMSTQIQFRLDAPTNVELVIYNITGEPVSVITTGHFEYGLYNVSWDGTDEDGNITKSGVYFVKLKTGFGSKMIKLMLVK